MDEFPKFHWWFRRCIYRKTGWDFGFFYKPWPRELHQEGDMVMALIHLDGHISLRPWRWRLYVWRAGKPPELLKETP